MIDAPWAGPKLWCALGWRPGPLALLSLAVGTLVLIPARLVLVFAARTRR